MGTSEKMTPASPNASSALHEFRSDLGGYCYCGSSWLGEQKIKFRNGQVPTTSWEDKCPFHKIIANIWPRPCYFVGSAAPSMVALFGAGIGTGRAIFTAYIPARRLLGDERAGAGGPLATHQVSAQSVQPLPRYEKGVRTCARAAVSHS